MSEKEKENDLLFKQELERELQSLRREHFLGYQLKEEKVAIPERNGEVIVRQLTARAMADYILTVQQEQEQGKKNTIREHLLVRCLYNADGERIFGDGDVDVVGDLPHTIVARLYSVASRLNPMTDDESEEKELGNSDAPSTDSSTP